MVLVRTSERTGTCFIRTDQLDGETDWKLRLAVPSALRLASETVLTTSAKFLVKLEFNG